MCGACTRSSDVELCRIEPVVNPFPRINDDQSQGGIPSPRAAPLPRECLIFSRDKVKTRQIAQTIRRLFCQENCPCPALIALTIE